MDLRSGSPYWLVKNGLIAAYPALSRNEVCEVAVIGAGITGAMTAYLLARAGVDVLVLDKREAGWGSTAASTGLLLHSIDMELCELIEKVGERRAVRAYQLGLEAVRGIESLVEDLGHGCGFRRRRSLYLASRRGHVKRLEAEQKLRASHDLPCSFVDGAELARRFAIRNPAALLMDGDGEIDPLLLTHRLLVESFRSGARIFDRSGVTGFDRKRGVSTLSTDRGHKVRAKRVVFATGYESERYLRRRAGKLSSTFSIVTEPLEADLGPAGECLIWESARPYLYVRPTEDRRLIAGGLDEPGREAHDDPKLLGKKASLLLRRVSGLFPGSDPEISYAWGGTFGESSDGLAKVGELEQFPGACFAVGYGGNGITFGYIAARILCSICLGREDPDLEIVRFNPD